MALLNLAREPFVNARPLKRICTLLTVLAALLLVVNGFLFWSYLSGSAGLRGQLRDIRAEIAAERQAIDGIRSQVAGYDLRSQNEQAEFLNYQIRQRTFGWSLLFERLGEVLPNKVKISTLSPALAEGNTGRAIRVAESEDVELRMRGTSADGENLLDLLDRLFAHPAFKSPRLLSENREESGELTFELSTLYMPSGPVQAAEEDAAEDNATRDPVAAIEPGSEDVQGEDVDSSSGERFTAREPASGSSGQLPAGIEPPPRDPRGASAPTMTAQQPAESAQSGTSSGAPADSTTPRGTTLRPPDQVDRSSQSATSSTGTTADRRTRPRPAAAGSRFQPGRPQPRRADGQTTSPRTTPTRSLPGVPTVPVQPTRNASSPGGRR